MKKIYAWTLAEMVIAITVLILLSGIAMSILKPNTQKAKIFVYATIRNIEKANIAIAERYEELNLADVGANDWYCTQLADLFSIKGTANCTSTSNNGSTVNMTLSNDVTISGAANKWRAPYSGAEFWIKDISIDINGAKGPNKVWVDKFPLRIFTGDIYTGMVRPVNCQNDQIYNVDTGAVTTLSPKHPFCDSTNYLIDDSIITYDIIKAESEGVEDEEGNTTARAKVLKMGLPVLTADCYAYGGIGTYPRAQCKASSLKLLPECVHPETCRFCSADSNNTCPNAYNTTAKCQAQSEAVNPDELPCTIVLHKTGSAITGMFGDLTSDISM